MPGAYGFEAGGEFAPAYEAAQRRLRANFARQKGELAQGLASRGVRTSGVGSIPGETLERGQSEAETGLIGDFAMRQAGEGITDRRLGEEFERRKGLMRFGADIESDLHRTMARRMLQGQLMSGGINAILSLLKIPGGGVGASNRGAGTGG